MFLCEKIFDDKETYQDEQMEMAGKFQHMKIIKRKKPFGDKKEENKNIKKKNKN